MKFYVKKDVSKKTGTPYCALICDLGYRKLFLSSHENSWCLCAELLAVPVADLMSMDNGEYEVK